MNSTKQWANSYDGTGNKYYCYSSVSLLNLSKLSVARRVYLLSLSRLQGGRSSPTEAIVLEFMGLVSDHAKIKKKKIKK